MKLARVQGTVVCTIKHPTYEGRRLMLCALLDVHGNPTGKQEIAVDLVQAGVGDQVLIMSEGNGVRQLLGSDAGPIRDVIVGVVDLISVDHTQQEQSDHLDQDDHPEQEANPSSDSSISSSSSSETASQNMETQDIEPQENSKHVQENEGSQETHYPTLKGAS